MPVFAISFCDRLGAWLEQYVPEPPGHGCFEIGLDPTSLSLSLFGEYRVGGLTVHVVYRYGSLALWATPDAGPPDDGGTYPHWSCVSPSRCHGSSASIGWGCC